LTIQDDEDVPLRVESLAEAVVESFISGAKRALGALITLQALNPLDLLLPIELFLDFLPLAPLLRHSIRVHLASRLDRLGDRVEFHLLEVLHSPIDAIYCKQLIARFFIMA